MQIYLNTARLPFNAAIVHLKRHTLVALCEIPAATPQPKNYVEVHFIKFQAK